MSSILLGFLVCTLFSYLATSKTTPRRGVLIATYALVGVVLGGVVAQSLDMWRPRHEVAQPLGQVFVANEDTVAEWTNGESQKFPTHLRAVYTKGKFVMAISQGDRTYYRFFTKSDGRMVYMDSGNIRIVREENRIDGAWQMVCRKYLFDFDPHWASFSLEILARSACYEELVVPLGGVESERWPT